MEYSNQPFGNGRADIEIEAVTGGKVIVRTVDAAGDDTVVHLTYDDIQELMQKLELAAELVGKPLVTLADLHELFQSDASRPGPEAA